MVSGGNPGVRFTIWGARLVSSDNGRGFMVGESSRVGNGWEVVKRVGGSICGRELDQIKRDTMGTTPVRTHPGIETAIVTGSEIGSALPNEIG